jgi:hypothetical protein
MEVTTRGILQIWNDATWSISKGLASQNTHVVLNPSVLPNIGEYWIKEQRYAWRVILKHYQKQKSGSYY